MKKSFYISTLIIIALTIFSVAPAFAKVEPGHGGDVRAPINSGLVFLLVAGFVIGVTLIAKAKSSKIQS